MSLIRVYCSAHRRKHSHSTLSSGKLPVLRYNMNRVLQSMWISLTSGDSVMLSFGVGVSWDDSTTLLAFAKAFEMLGSWSSYSKTPAGTIAWVNRAWLTHRWSHFFLIRYASTRDRRNCFLTCRNPGSTIASCRQDMTTLCWPDWQRAVSPRELLVSIGWVP
jgi:hypothetical protein